MAIQLKTEYVPIPLSLPKVQAQFFTDYGRKFGISRNACLCMALKFGGPMLAATFGAMRDQVKQQCEAIAKRKNKNGKRNRK